MPLVTNCQQLINFFQVNLKVHKRCLAIHYALLYQICLAFQSPSYDIYVAVSIPISLLFLLYHLLNKPKNLFTQIEKILKMNRVVILMNCIKITILFHIVKEFYILMLILLEKTAVIITCLTTSLFACISDNAHGWWRLTTARANGVLPSLSTAWTSAPACINVTIQILAPHSAA